jgi:GNAT superfamily N-acetyltransferase
VSVTVGTLEEGELERADQIFRLAFGTFVGLPDPTSFAGDMDYVRTRWRADRSSALAARDGGRLLGSNFVTRWGSFGFFGPLSVHPERWRGGIARLLLDRTMEVFDGWGVQGAGLFTFSSSTLHVGLYQRFGFWPRHLTAVCGAPAEELGRALRLEPSAAPVTQAFSSLPSDERAEALRSCAILTDAVEEGLDLGAEIGATAAHEVGETLLVRDARGEVEAFAVCHVGAGTEAGSDTVYVKFGAARAGAGAAQRLERLLAGCVQLARARGVGHVVAGVNTARAEAYRLLLGHGFRIEILGVAMQRGPRPGTTRPGAFVLDDWR